MSDIASFRIASQQDVDSDDQGGVALSVGWVAAGNALQGNEARPGPVRAQHTCTLWMCNAQTCTHLHNFSCSDLHTYTVAHPVSVQHTRTLWMCNAQACTHLHSFSCTLTQLHTQSEHTPSQFLFHSALSHTIASYLLHTRQNPAQYEETNWTFCWLNCSAGQKSNLSFLFLLSFFRHKKQVQLQWEEKRSCFRSIAICNTFWGTPLLLSWSNSSNVEEEQCKHTFCYVPDQNIRVCI